MQRAARASSAFRRGAARALVVPWLVSALGVAAVGCLGPRNTFQSGLPGSETPFSVTSVRPLAGVLDVTLAGPAASLRTFVPPGEACLTVLQPEATVQYRSAGPYGSFVRDGETCEAIGLGSLAQWRDRRPSQTKVVMSPRAQARFRVVQRGPDEILLRGRFPLAGLVGFVGLDDSLAVVPNDAACRRAVESGVASMQYYQQGPDVLALLSGDQLCPITGLIRPPSAQDPGF